MDYHEAANFLFGLRRFAIDPGTDSVEALLSALGSPQDSFESIQIAGSNGKGSTARMVESILRADGLTVGLYTSPHLGDLSEQIRVDGRPMADSAITDFVAETRPWLVQRTPEDDPLTFFEVVTAMALWQFERADVDIAVLEVGMGGEYDATSVVDPVAAAVTNVSLEHTSVLGDTVEEIARTKAAVAPENAPLVTAATGSALDTIHEVVGDVLTVGTGADESSDDIVAVPNGRVSSQESAVTIRGDDWTLAARIPLLGEYQATNAGVAVALAGQVLGFDEISERAETGDAVGSVESQESQESQEYGDSVVSAEYATSAESTESVENTETGVRGEQGGDSGIISSPTAPGSTDRETTFHRGLRQANWPGRFEVMSDSPLVVLDGAHNPDACSTVTRTLSTFEYDTLEIVFAAMHDKDHEGMISELPRADRVTVCELAPERAEDAAVLAEAVSATVDSDTVVREAGSVAGAFSAARDRADDADAVLLTGSLSAVREARAVYKRLQVFNRVDDVDAAERVLHSADVPRSDVDRLSGKAVHRVIRTTLEPEEAQQVQRELLRIGGECAVSGVEDGERVSVVLSGTRPQFEQLASALADGSNGLPSFVTQLARRLNLDTTGAGSSRPRTGDSTGGTYPWGTGTAVMGVLNVTPDSFHDGGQYYDPAEAVEQAEAMVAAGADIIDIGGESTRPGADPVSIQEEIDRVVPVIEAVSTVDARLSVDSRKATVAAAALDAGADILNDVTGLEDPGMRFLAAERDVPVVVMHSIDAPVVPGRHVEYDDVVDDVLRDLRERVLLAEKAGVPRENVIVDPGLGFGKSAAESFELLDRIDEFEALGCPVLVGHSHKSMFERAGGTAGDALDETIAASALAADRGADIIRVHDVAENVAAINVATATRAGTRDSIDPPTKSDRQPE